MDFLLSLPQSGPSRFMKAFMFRNAKGNVDDLDMDPDACLVISGIPVELPSSIIGLYMDGVACIRQTVLFPPTGTILMEFLTPELAAVVLANEHRLLNEAGLLVRKLGPLFSPERDVTTSQRDRYLSQHEQQQRAANQMPMNREQLQRLTTEIKHLNTAFRRERDAKGSALDQCKKLKQETVHLKNQAQADKMENACLRGQISASNTSSYDMSRSPRGIVVIINNIHFEDMADRDGAEGDTERERERERERVEGREKREREGEGRDRE
ncbi:uncharacterized protein [Branchiostoma lanceolatum]|uniref:uncharacterized protein n=1 Tax=Branchiostoma lanceolatum TaxID=7740 RepID=UPI003456B9CF